MPPLSSLPGRGGTAGDAGAGPELAAVGTVPAGLGELLAAGRSHASALPTLSPSLALGPAAVTGVAPRPWPSVPPHAPGVVVAGVQPRPVPLRLVVLYDSPPLVVKGR